MKLERALQWIGIALAVLVMVAVVVWEIYTKLALIDAVRGRP